VTRAGRGGARAALLTAAGLGVSVDVVIADQNPWHVISKAPGGFTPVDPTAGLSPEQVERAKSFAAALRPASLTSLAHHYRSRKWLALPPCNSLCAEHVKHPQGLV